MDQTTINYKEETKKAYDNYTEEFEKRFEEHFQKNTKKQIDLFTHYVKGGKLVDLGCGAGNHAKYFTEKGFDLLCIDISEEMVKRCMAKGLKAEVRDIEQLDLSDKSFDGVWSYASLLHVPKEKIPAVIQKIVRMLRPQGLLGLAVKEGTGEGLEEKKSYPGAKRWFTYFTEAEILELFGKEFELLEFSKTNIENKFNFMNYIFRLR